ncbi:hypothetical protein GCM10011505_38710 [Tistrella bauzanensis]|uniref:Alpha/beta hydrolase fold-3 domain-containing protein n=1 Tax=Tistrella bauzanensis TaxID=657419 RepID=A0ABQ1IW87_9PROT|nr:alpha/beta hydrolase [Tistrella bauzanensis]GGB53951.1 hypothetical protein GCM10011505_38710 [Tistrella bauzanensis]
MSPVPERHTTPDPQAAWILDLVKASGRDPYHRMTPADARRMFDEVVVLLDLPRAELAVVRDLALPGPAGDMAVRLYRPEPLTLEAAPLPALLFIHGGGWTIGSLDAYDRLCRHVAAAAGIAVVSLDYRLAPEHPFPAAAEDAIAAWGALLRAAGDFGIDPERVAIGGDSAGGNLSAVAALAARDAGLAMPRLQWLIYPATDLAVRHPSRDVFAEGYLLDDATITWFLAQYLPDPALARDWRASPLHAPDHRGLPPALIVTAGCDPLADEGHAYAAALRAAGVAVEHRVYPGMLHGFINTAGALDQARDAVARSVDALKVALRG